MYDLLYMIYCRLNTFVTKAPPLYIFIFGSKKPLLCMIFRFKEVLEYVRNNEFQCSL